MEAVGAVGCSSAQRPMEMANSLRHEMKKKHLETFNTIDYCVDGIEKPVFQTCDKEKGKVVIQIVSKRVKLKTH